MDKKLNYGFVISTEGKYTGGFSKWPNAHPGKEMDELNGIDAWDGWIDKSNGQIYRQNNGWMDIGCVNGQTGVRMDG